LRCDARTVVGPESPERVRLWKASLRREVLGTLAATDPADRETMAAAAVRRALALPELATARVVAAYAAIPPELPTRSLLDRLRARGARVVLPAMRPDGSLGWREYDGTLAPGPRGTWEAAGPEAALDGAGAVVVPGVAFDPAGRRLGRGGGGYDRALAAVRVPVVAVAADAAVVGAVPTEPHDRPVDVVVTPTRVIRARPTTLDGAPAVPHH
jgi:5-formyltetrahydrofolate cyclo-ligase